MTPVSELLNLESISLYFAVKLEAMSHEVGLLISSNHMLPTKPETKGESLVGVVSILAGLTDDQQRSDKVAELSKSLTTPQRLRPMLQCKELVHFLTTMWAIPALRWGTLFYPNFIKNNMLHIHGGVSSFTTPISERFT